MRDIPYVVSQVKAHPYRFPNWLLLREEAVKLAAAAAQQRGLDWYWNNGYEGDCQARLDRKVPEDLARFHPSGFLFVCTLQLFEVYEMDTRRRNVVAVPIHLLDVFKPPYPGTDGYEYEPLEPVGMEWELVRVFR